MSPDFPDKVSQSRAGTVSVPLGSAAGTPGENYRQLLASPGFFHDPSQQQLVDLLDGLFHEIMEQVRRERSSRLNRWFRRKRALVTGLYLWGGVGRGKTLLMDLFYECLPEELRLRMHFHRFMQQVHIQLTELSGTPNPLQTIGRRLAGRARVLCFDEFFVADIGDAMILAELLASLFEHGVTLVATSNVAPGRLYENGLQRGRFLGAIELLKAHTRIHNVDGAVDYRLRALERAEIYHAPLDSAAEQSLATSLAALSPEAPREHVPLEVEGRTIMARYVADDVVWFEFAELCEGPRSQLDYIELARCYHAVLLSNVCRFDESNEDAARRFIGLVDEFYDHNVKLIISAESPVVDLYAGVRFQFEFERTRSRLLEMQSHEYLARSHRA